MRLPATQRRDAGLSTTPKTTPLSQPHNPLSVPPPLQNNYQQPKPSTLGSLTVLLATGLLESTQLLEVLGPATKAGRTAGDVSGHGVRSTRGRGRPRRHGRGNPGLPRRVRLVDHAAEVVAGNLTRPDGDPTGGCRGMQQGRCEWGGPGSAAIKCSGETRQRKGQSNGTQTSDATRTVSLHWKPWLAGGRWPLTQPGSR